MHLNHVLWFLWLTRLAWLIWCGMRAKLPFSTPPPWSRSSSILSIFIPGNWNPGKLSVYSVSGNNGLMAPNSCDILISLSGPFSLSTTHLQAHAHKHTQIPQTDSSHKWIRRGNVDTALKCLLSGSMRVIMMASHINGPDALYAAS